MLDFQKLVTQINDVGRESLTDRTPSGEIVQRAHAAFEEASEKPELLMEKLERGRSAVFWPLSLPLEPLGTRIILDRYNQPVTVAAVDGSQIMPSHHEICSCYLLNVGTAVLSYGAKFPPVLSAQPSLYHKPEDLYPLIERRRVHVDELYVSLKRGALELKAAVGAALEAKGRGLPVVALLDGSLIPWSVEKMPDFLKDEHIRLILESLETARQARLPVLGYISQSRSSDLVGALRVHLCPYKVSDCRQFCGSLDEQDFPCSQIWPLADRQLVAGYLPMHARSAVFVSGANCLRGMPEPHQICFAYLNVGNEIARLEFPRWIFQTPELLELSCRVVLAQVEKGSGYPVCLTEAHHLAVIRSPERSRFFELLERHLVSLGVERVNVSPKERRKRQSII